jgi:thiamine pyrophosphate-dependent acetolactate synthase large subunit-like protein
VSELRQSKEVLRAAEALRAAARPAILIGPEGRPAVRALLAMAERLGAAVLTTPDAKSLVDSRRTCGTFSFGSSALARAVMANADVVLAVSALGEFSCRLGEGLRGSTLIQLTERGTDVGRNSAPSVSLVGPKLEQTAERLEAALRSSVPRPRAPWFAQHVARCSTPPSEPVARGVMQPIAAMGAIQQALPEAVRVCLDVTSGALHAYEHLRLTTRQRVFSSIESSACMGEALLASLGIRLASNLPTLALVGDWGYCMTPAELHTAVELGLDRYVVLVWANSGGAFIGAGTKQQGLAVPDAAWRWRAPPDFARVASAYGAHGVTVTDASALQSELTRALRAAGPVVIEARVDPAAAVPAGDRFLTLGSQNDSEARP